jgi:hypothetical protein
LQGSEEAFTQEYPTHDQTANSEENEYSELNSFEESEDLFEESRDYLDEEISLDDDCGDRLTFKSGAFLEVKVIQVNKHDVVYRRCDDLNGPAYTVIKDDLAELKYAHGGTEDLKVRNAPNGVDEQDEEEEEEKRSDLSDDQKPIEPFALISFIFSLTYILWIPGIILGIISLVIQKKNPDQYRSKSKFFAGFGIIFPLIAILIGVGIFFLILFFW